MEYPTSNGLFEQSVALKVFPPKSVTGAEWSMMMKTAHQL